MEDLFRSYWWLLFPLAFFLFGAWDRWLSYRRHRDELDLIKTFTAQGKEPPAELLRRVREGAEEEDDYLGLGDPGRVSRRMRRRFYRGTYWEWRTAIITGAVAAAFWVASEYGFVAGTEGAFRLVAIILACVSGAHFLFAILNTLFRRR